MTLIDLQASRYFNNPAESYNLENIASIRYEFMNKCGITIFTRDSVML